MTLHKLFMLHLKVKRELSLATLDCMKACREHRVKAVGISKVTQDLEMWNELKGDNWISQMGLSKLTSSPKLTYHHPCHKHTYKGEKTEKERK